MATESCLNNTQPIAPNEYGRPDAFADRPTKRTSCRTVPRSSCCWKRRTTVSIIYIRLYYVWTTEACSVRAIHSKYANNDETSVVHRVHIVRARVKKYLRNADEQKNGTTFVPAGTVPELWILGCAHFPKKNTKTTPKTKTSTTTTTVHEKQTTVCKSAHDWPRPLLIDCWTARRSPYHAGRTRDLTCVMYQCAIERLHSIDLLLSYTLLLPNTKDEFC